MIHTTEVLGFTSQNVTDFS